MNCQPGDLTLVINAPTANLGRMVTCIECHLPSETIIIRTPIGPAVVHCTTGPFWRVDLKLVGVLSDGRITEAEYIADYCLLPIRPERDEDHDLTQAASDELARRLSGNPMFFGSITEPTT